MGSRGALISTLLAQLCEAAVPITAYPNTSAARAPPRFGFGNELVLQSTNDTQVSTALAASGSAIGRYPGGTPSDYWDWQSGWLKPNSPCESSSNGNYALRRTTPQDWAAFLAAGNVSDSVIDLCQLTCNLTNQIDGLKAHQAAGTAIKYVELGNEMYDSSRSDVLAKYPVPSDYAAAMLPWVEAIKKEFPSTQVALVGERWNSYHNPREDGWNHQVLHSAAGDLADAATLHIYCGWDANNNASTDENIASHLAVAATRAFNNGDNVAHNFPAHLKIWVTEMGLYPAGPLDGTWLHAMFYTALDMQLPVALPSLDIITPYCFMCGDETASAFTTAQYGPVIPPAAAGTVPVLRQPSGEAQSKLFKAVRSAHTLIPLVFSSDDQPLSESEPRSKQLLGWALQGSSVQWVVLNQGVATTVEVMGEPIGSCSGTVSCIHPSSQADVTRHGLLASELVHSSPHFVNDSVLLPSYSLCTCTMA